MQICDLDDPDLAIADIMRRWPDTISVFTAHRMLCVGCLVGPFHTIDDACTEYRLEPAVLRAELRAAIRSGAAKAPPTDAAAPR